MRYFVFSCMFLMTNFFTAKKIVCDLFFLSPDCPNLPKSISTDIYSLKELSECECPNVFKQS